MFLINPLAIAPEAWTAIPLQDPPTRKGVDEVLSRTRELAVELLACWCIPPEEAKGLLLDAHHELVLKWQRVAAKDTWLVLRINGRCVRFWRRKMRDHFRKYGADDAVEAQFGRIFDRLEAITERKLARICRQEFRRPVTCAQAQAPAPSRTADDVAIPFAGPAGAMPVEVKPHQEPAEPARVIPVDLLPILCERVQPALARIFWKYRIPPDDAEDLRQTTLQLALLRWSEIRRPCAWIVGTLENRCILYWRERRLHGERHEPLEPWVPILAVAPAQERRVMLDELEKLARRLPPQQRLVLSLRLQGMGSVEIARATGLAPTSVRSLAHRAIKFLRSALASPRPQDRDPA